VDHLCEFRDRVSLVGVSRTQLVDSLPRGFLAFFGMLAVPIPRVENHAFIPLILDCGYMVTSITFGLIGMALSRPFRGKKSDRSDKTGSPIE
jgi:hypothetical protein